jgi:metal-dependent amidase/aminoacylase/carboxypeptidase family protein
MKLIEGGVFTDVDCAMMIHGLDRTILHADLLGIVRVNFDFTGKAAHASADPWQGVNALDAVIQTFNAISALRQQVRPDVRIHGIITNGGQAPNIIPEAASATFYVRAATLDYMWEVYKKVVACAEGAARATGAQLRTVQVPTVYEPLKRNETLLGAFKVNLERLGDTPEPPDPSRLGSSDIGNVSQVIPAIQPYIKIAEAGTPIHSRAFAEAAVKPLARRGLVTAAKTMAMTTADLLADPALVRRAKDEFAASK